MAVMARRHQQVAVCAVVAGDGNANAGTDDELMVIDLVALAHPVDDATGQRGGVGRLVDVDLQNREFIAAHACQRITGSEQTAQPLGDSGQQLVASGMAQRIIDILKVVEIQKLLGHHGIGPGLAQRLLEPLAKQRPIGQPRERIVMGQVGDGGLRAAQLGDVLMRGDPTAVRHRLDGDGKMTAVAELGGVRAKGLAGRQARQQRLGELFRVASRFAEATA
jgi:hypothetical protein